MLEPKRFECSSTLCVVFVWKVMWGAKNEIGISDKRY